MEGHGRPMGAPFHQGCAAKEAVVVLLVKGGESWISFEVGLCAVGMHTPIHPHWHSLDLPIAELRPHLQGMTTSFGNGCWCYC